MRVEISSRWVVVSSRVTLPQSSQQPWGTGLSGSGVFEGALAPYRWAGAQSSGDGLGEVLGVSLRPGLARAIEERMGSRSKRPTFSIQAPRAAILQAGAVVMNCGVRVWHLSQNGYGHPETTHTTDNMCARIPGATCDSNCNQLATENIVLART